MNRLLTTLLVLGLLSGAAFADGKSYTRYRTAADINLATGYFKCKSIIAAGSVASSRVRLIDGHAATGTLRIEIYCPAIVVSGTDAILAPVTRQINYALGDDDFLLFSTGIYVDVTSATVEILLQGDGLTTIQNDNSTTQVLIDAELNARYNIVAGGQANLRDEFAIWVLQNKSNWSVP